MLDFIPAIVWFIFYSVVGLIALLILIFAPKVVASQNEMIIAKGKEEQMTAAEIKRTIRLERHFSGFLLIVCFVQSAEYLAIVLGG